MKPLFSLFFALLAASVQAQFSPAEIDSLAKIFRCDTCKTVNSLTIKLIEPLTLPKDKARIIFAWVATNVRYDFAKSEMSESERLEQKKDSKGNFYDIYEYWDVIAPSITLKSRKGVCEDYAMLYRAMAKVAGIECELVSGFSRQGFKVSKVAHLWNAIKIDNEWHLLDVTFGAGHVDDDEKFRKLYAPIFFMTPPKLFRTNHFPKKSEWQLIEEEMSQADFEDQPVVNYRDAMFAISEFEPVGKLTKVDKKVEVRLKFETLPPPYFTVLNNGEKHLEFTQSEEDGFVILQIEVGSTSQIIVGGGTEQSGKRKILAKFQID